MTTTPTPWILATPSSIDPRRYRHARELMEQALLDLLRVDPPDQTRPSVVDAWAHLARASLDMLAEDTLTTYPPQPPDWPDIARALGLTTRQARRLITNHLDPPDDNQPPHDED